MSARRGWVGIAVACAGLLLAGLVSDTLNLTSPTTTDHDVQILARLEKISGVNAREFNRTGSLSAAVFKFSKFCV